jgi:hypothetical protein
VTLRQSKRTVNLHAPCRKVTAFGKAGLLRRRSVLCTPYCYGRGKGARGDAHSRTAYVSVLDLRSRSMTSLISSAVSKLCLLSARAL